MTYAEDTATGDGWFADLRDELGRVVDSGGGHTQAAARAHLMERVERAGSERATAAAPAAGTRLHTLAGHVGALVEQGYEVSFTTGFGADKLAAHVEKPGDPDAGCTALGYTAAAALWAASPLHAGDVPFIVTDEGAADADLEDFNDRLNDLENRFGVMEKHERTERALCWTVIELICDGRPDSELARKWRAGQVREVVPASDATAASPN